MRHTVEARGIIPEGCTDPRPLLDAERRTVLARAHEIMRADPHWKMLAPPIVTVNGDGRGYRVYCVLDTDEGMMANPDEGGNRT